MKILEAITALLEGKTIYAVKKDKYSDNVYYKLLKTEDFEGILKRYGEKDEWKLGFIHFEQELIEFMYSKFEILEEIKGKDNE